MSGTFADRREAGRLLARWLKPYADREDVLVLALPRGGVPVGYEVARALHAPLDVFLVRKLGVPGHEELAMGALASGGIRVLNPEVIHSYRITDEELDRAVEEEQDELRRRERLYRGSRSAPHVRDKTLILVDDGLATGSTMRAVVTALRFAQPAEMVVAVPTAAPVVCKEFRKLADDCVCVMTPEPFRAVGLWYDDFSQVSDDEVRELLTRAGSFPGAGDPEPAHRD